ncbi:MAG: hypothetical protein PVG87_15530 [Desulfobacteraceae bacterium]
MLNWWTIWQLSKIEHAKNLKNAEMLRRSRRESTDQNRSIPFIPVMLNHLGKLLVASGLFLQRRFGTLTK